MLLLVWYNPPSVALAAIAVKLRPALQGVAGRNFTLFAPVALTMTYYLIYELDQLVLRWMTVSGSIPGAGHLF